MAAERFATLVVGYEEVEVASADFRDLSALRRDGEVGEYEAAVVRRIDSVHELVATTIDPRLGATLVGACLGVVVGTVISPALAVIAVGAGLGAVLGNVGDQIDAFKHADMDEVERLVDDSAANLIVIAAETTVREIESAAVARGRRIVVQFSDADIEVLKRELQQLMSFGS